MELTWVNKPTVTLVNSMGDDYSIVDAARVSVRGAKLTERDTVADIRLLQYLMSNRHGSPFEHAALNFRISIPKAVAIEHLRHRIGWSYNEESQRYREVEGVFYLPDESRVQSGKPGHYIYEPGRPDQTRMMQDDIQVANRIAWRHYQSMLADGIAREQARWVLPMNHMTTLYTTCNPRSMMHFLGLRSAPNAMQEIRDVAALYELAFADKFPTTHAAWEQASRVAP